MRTWILFSLLCTATIRFQLGSGCGGASRSSRFSHARTAYTADGQMQFPSDYRE